MKRLNDNAKNERGKLLFYSDSDEKGFQCFVHEHIPNKGELNYYEDQDIQPLECIKELLIDKSLAEQKMATSSIDAYIDLAWKVAQRLHKEEMKQSKLKQPRLFE